jgi:endonuclease YncB( thermonuclease family)
MPFAAGCYDPPEFPLITTVPIEAAPGSSCVDDPDTVVACTVDGDTLDAVACGADVGLRVRLLGIDAPELDHGSGAECGADAAHAELTRLVAARPVTLSFDLTCTDVYDRTLAYVYLMDDEIDPFRDEPGVEDLIVDLSAGDGGEALLVNEWLLWQGFVWPFDEDWVGPLILQQRLDSATSHARDGGLGLWSTCAETTTPPTPLSDTPAPVSHAEDE